MGCVRLNPFDGPVKVYVKDIGETANTPVTDGVVDWDEWTDLGYKYQSDEGVQVEASSTIELVQPMGFTGGVKRAVTGEAVTVTVSIKKTSVENIARYGLPGATFTDRSEAEDPTVTTLGGAHCLAEFSLGLEGYSPDGGKVVMYFPRVTVSDSMSLQFRKGDTEAPFSFAALSDETANEGAQIFTLWDIPLT
jgi:hypothetical protein